MNYKDQINSLMRNFAVFLKTSDRKANNRSEKLSDINPEMEQSIDLTNGRRFIEKKDDILLFLYIMAVNLANEDYVANINTIPEFSNITFIENSNNYVPGIKNKMILKNIRNAFDHASGEIETQGEDIIITNNQKMKNGSIVRFSIKQPKKNLIDLMKKSIANQQLSQNPIIRNLLSDIKKIENDDLVNVSDELSYIILMNLLLCYNKESLIDKYVQSQTSFLDLSKFSVTTREEWDQKELNEEFFDLYNLIFKSEIDRKSFNREWRAGKRIQRDLNKSFVYDIEKYPVDTRTRKHIPTPIILKHLRDANAHGWLEFKEDKILLLDRKKKNSAPYIKISMSQEDMWSFLSHDIFYESMYTDIDTFSSQRDEEMFFFERARSANNFEDYIRIYQLRLPNKNKKAVIEYLFNSNKISTYVLEHPEQLQSVLDYKINSSETVLQYAIKKSGMSIEELKQKWKRFGRGNTEWAKNYSFVGKKYFDALIGKDNEFYKAYYCFLYNKDRIKGFLDYNNLSVEENTIVEKGADKLRLKLKDSWISMWKNPIILTEVMHTMFPKNDVNVFYDTVYAIKDYNKYHDRIKPKHFTVMNVERYNSLNQERETGINQQLALTEKRREISKKKLIAVGIIAAAQGVFAYLRSRGLCEDSFAPAMAIGGTMGMIVFRNSLFWGAKNFLEKYKMRQTKNIEKYEEFLNEMKNQDFNNGGR